MVFSRASGPAFTITTNGETGIRQVVQNELRATRDRKRRRADARCFPPRQHRAGAPIRICANSGADLDTTSTRFVWMTQGITVAGIPIPSHNPWFLALIAVHVAGGLTATVAGAIAMLSRKASGRHPRSGTIYFWALVVVTVTTAALALDRWPADNALALLGVLAFASALVGRTARRRRWRRWQRVHIPGMRVSYVVMLTAFYVDNGPHLPLWNRLPVVAFWLLPAAAGTPLILYAWRKYVGGDRPIGPSARAT
jgi:uncharacterized membrane protein